MAHTTGCDGDSSTMGQWLRNGQGHPVLNAASTTAITATPAVRISHGGVQSENSLSLEAGQEKDEDDQYTSPNPSIIRQGRSGIGIALKKIKKGHYKVSKLAPGGPASKCGVICVGDEIVAFDGNSVLGAAPGEIKEMLFGPAGSTVNLSLRRLQVNYFVSHPIPTCSSHSSCSEKWKGK